MLKYEDISQFTQQQQQHQQYISCRNVGEAKNGNIGGKKPRQGKNTSATRVLRPLGQRFAFETSKKSAES